MFFNFDLWPKAFRPLKPYHVLLVCKKNNTKWNSFFLFQIDCICIEKSDEPINETDFVSRKVPKVISVHVSGCLPPSSNPYFIHLFQFVDKMSWCINVSTFLLIDAGISLYLIVNNSSYVHCPSCTRQRRPGERIHTVLRCSEYSCGRVIPITFVQMHFFEFNYCFNGNISEMIFQTCMKSNNTVCATLKGKRK